MKMKIICLLILFLLAIPGNVPAADERVVIDIRGMTCSLCPIAIKKSLAGIDGVKEVEVSYEDKKARLTADDSVADKQLLEAIKKVGPYQGEITARTPVPR